MKNKEPLCSQCRHYEYSNVAHTRVTLSVPFKRSSRNFCEAFSAYIEREATECNKFDDKKNPTLDTLEKMAFILEKKNVVGFERPVFEFKKPEVNHD